MLWIEFPCERYQTTRWTRAQWQIPGFGLGLEVGEIIAGLFAIDGVPGIGLFSAQVVAATAPGRRPLTAALDWLSPHGGLMLDSARQGAVMTLWSACPSCDWSLSGLRVAGYVGDATVGTRVAGRIRHPRSEGGGDFVATVQRIDIKRKELALAFLDLSSEAFCVLETAIRKRPIRP